MTNLTFYSSGLKLELAKLIEKVKPFRDRELDGSDYKKLESILDRERQDYLRDLLRDEVKQESQALEAFTNKYVKPHFFIDKNQNPLAEKDLNISLILEGRCNSCNHVAVVESPVNELITDFKLPSYLGRKQREANRNVGEILSYEESLHRTGIFPECGSHGCDSGELTSELVASKNIIRLNKKNFYNIKWYSQREKSSGRTRDKLIDIMLELKSSLNDRMAARFVVSKPKDVYAIVEELNHIRRNNTKITFKPDGILPENYEDFLKHHKEKNIPLRFDKKRYYKKSEDYYAAHLGVPWGWAIMEVQVKTKTWHKIAEETYDLDHKRRWERQEEERKEKWGDIGFMLRDYLTPCFGKFDIINYLQRSAF
ncbi:MAG: hypothetical protein ABIB43_02165 [archaeon]